MRALNRHLLLPAPPLRVIQLARVLVPTLLMLALPREMLPLLVLALVLALVLLLPSGSPWRASMNARRVRWQARTSW